MMLIDYTLDHLFDLKIDLNKYPICQGKFMVLQHILDNGISKTVVTKDGKPIAIISVMLYHTGVAGVYILPSIEAHNDNKKTFIESVKLFVENLDDIARIYKLKRMETVTKNDKKHNKFMEYFGFLPEGVKKAYGLNGEDFMMWSKLWV